MPSGKIGRITSACNQRNNYMYYVTFRILVIVVSLFLWHLIHLIHRSTVCLNGQQAILFHQLLPQKLQLPLMEFKGRGEYGFVELTKVCFSFVVVIFYQLNIDDTNLRIKYLKNVELWKIHPMRCIYAVIFPLETCV